MAKLAYNYFNDAMIIFEWDRLNLKNLGVTCSKINKTRKVVNKLNLC